MKLPAYKLALLVTAMGALGGCASLPGGSSTPAVVESLSVTGRKPAFGGQAFGSAGAYEFISGVATVSLDPRAAANARIRDLPAAAGPDGRVRYRTDVAILRPVSAAGASGTLLVDIANRGNKLALARLADGANQFDTAAQAGNGWFMRQGHAVAWIGWQGDVPLGKAGEVVGTDFPVARAGGASIEGDVQEEFIFDKAEARSRGPLTYAHAQGAGATAQLTVKAHATAPATTLPATAWRFIGEKEVEIDRAAGFDAGAIYTLVYRARDPRPMGLGFSALRDVTSFLKGSAPDGAGQAHPLADLQPRTTLVLGISQSGRFLRDFIWEGFNADAQGGRVFDAAMPLIAGARKSYVNMRFAQPGRYSRQHEDRYYPGDQFPFTYATTTDPVTGATDGIFARCTTTGTCPKLMHVDSSLEFWQARSSLLTVDSAGRAIAAPEQVRYYLMGGTQHGPAQRSSAGICQQPNNTAVQAPLVRALFQHLDRWARDGVAPPASRFPMAPADLAPLDRAAIGFPDLSPLSVRFPTVFNSLAVVDPTRVPFQPNAQRGYASLLPKTNADGHDLAAVRLPDVDVPLATYTGWNLRKAGFAENQLCGINGMELPLAADAAQRQRTRDPRPSMAERYGSRAGYVQQVEASAARAVAQGFLLQEDAARFVEAARREPRVAPLAP
jgi:hypothetical protein